MSVWGKRQSSVGENRDGGVHIEIEEGTVAQENQGRKASDATTSEGAAYARTRG